MGEAAELYAEQLSSSFCGHPLWFPESTDAGGTQIGDVGVVENGQFHRLFNITVAADHPWNALHGVPEGFVPLGIRVYTRQVPIKAGLICGYGVEPLGLCPQVFRSEADLSAVNNVNGRYQFECSNGPGALLALNRPAVRETTFRPMDIERYIFHHYRTWKTFVNQRRTGYHLSEVVCIYGWVDAPEWTVAAFMPHNGTESHDCLIEGQFGPFQTSECQLTVTNNVQMSVQHRSSPADPVPQASSTDSTLSFPTPVQHANKQTVFIEYYKIKYRPSESKAYQTPIGTPYSSDSGLDDITRKNTVVAKSKDKSSEQVLPATQARLPLDFILDYLLKHSDADAAITSHALLYTMLMNLGNSSDWQGDLFELLKRTPIDIDNEAATVYWVSQWRSEEFAALKPQQESMGVRTIAIKDWAIPFGQPLNSRVTYPGCSGQQRDLGIPLMASSSQGRERGLGAIDFMLSSRDLQVYQPSSDSMHRSAYKTLHSDLEGYLCNICGKQFSRSSALSCHMHGHLSCGKGIACGIGDCKKVFSVMSNCRRHQRSHKATEQERSTADQSTDAQSNNFHPSSTAASMSIPVLPNARL